MLVSNIKRVKAIFFSLELIICLYTSYAHPRYFKLEALNENSRGFRRGGYDEKYDDAREV